MPPKKVKKTRQGRGNGKLPPHDGTVKVRVVKGNVQRYYKVRGKRPPRERTPEQIKKHRENMDRALQLKVAGATYTQIGQALGLSNNPASARTLAYNLIKEAMEAIAPEPAEELLKLRLLRYEEMIRFFWRDFVSTDDPDLRIRIGDAIGRVTDRQGRDLNIGNPSNPTVQINNQSIHAPGSGNGVLIIQGNEPEYLAMLQKAAGSTVPELDFVDVVPKEKKVIEGEVEEKDEEE